MDRRSFFKAFAALGATVVVAPTVLAKIAEKNSPYPIGQAGLMMDVHDDIYMDFNKYLEEVTRYHPGEKIMFVGGKTMERINEHATQQAGGDYMGIKVTKLRTPHGVYHTVETPYFNKEVGFVDANESSPFIEMVKATKYGKPVKPKIEWIKREIKPRWK